MKTNVSEKLRSQIIRLFSPGQLVLVAGIATFWSAGTAQANVRLESTGGPFYARIERGLIHTDGEWVAIPFYRALECVPADFDLLDFFNPAALGCRSFVSGFEVWKNGPWAGDPGPIQTRLQNTGPMPILFVKWSELDAAIADGVLTVGELQHLPSLLVGAATFYTETLHPFQAAQQTMISIVASGSLEDGRQFSYEVTETNGQVRHMRIVFK